MKKITASLIFILVLFGLFAVFGLKQSGFLSPLSVFTAQLPSASVPNLQPEPSLIPIPSPSPSPVPSPIPSADPKIYGPCKLIPVLMYHHVQPESEASEKGQKNLTVDASIFANQMTYLASRGYKTLTPDQLIDGLNAGLSGRSVLLTFDDAYEDFYKYAYPELVKNGFHATVFVPTGLVGNPDYLDWNQISEMHGSGLITFADHTWSHKSLGRASDETIRYEIGTAKKQLEDHGLGPITSFAYPYGSENLKIDSIMKEMGITSAFTTIPGSYQCAKLPYDLMRRRVGNSSLSSYGL